jgi:hypothetical protein
MTGKDRGGRGLGQPARLGTWSQQQGDDYDLARGVLTALIGTYAARIAAADDPAEADRLLAEQLRYAAERRVLTVTDDDAVARILREYPALVRQIGEGAGS